MAETERLLIRPEVLEIPEDDPFKKDLLERKAFALMMAELVSHTHDSLVLALQVSAQQGKSIDLQQLAAYLYTNEGTADIGAALMVAAVNYGNSQYNISSVNDPNEQAGLYTNIFREGQSNFDSMFDTELQNIGDHAPTSGNFDSPVQSACFLKRMAYIDYVLAHCHKFNRPPLSDP